MAAKLLVQSTYRSTVCPGRLSTAQPASSCKDGKSGRGMGAAERQHGCRRPHLHASSQRAQHGAWTPWSGPWGEPCGSGAAARRARLQPGGAVPASGKAQRTGRQGQGARAAAILGMHMLTEDCPVPCVAP